MKVDWIEDAQFDQKHPVETSELIASKLQELVDEMNKLDDKLVEGFRQAEKKCPQLLDDDFRLRFLRCEVFNSDLAAKRLAMYWNKRIELFGPEKAFLPLTLKEALRDDEWMLRVGIVRFVGSNAPGGRSLVLMDPTRRDKTKHSREGTVRCLWYVLHAALEEPETQKHGLIFMVHPRHAQLKNFDRKLPPMMAESIRGCLPVRVSAMCICHPPSFFAIVWAIMKLVLSKPLLKRVRVYSGSDEKVLARLQEDGLEKSVLPADVGGDVVLDAEKWLDERKEQGL